ncbi:MAG: MFS transporter, partial [Parasporobacterium sp.]|nr:MFS transporter [Parasporobacterium sp.]
MKDIQLKQDGRYFFGWAVVLLGFILMLLAYVGCVSLTGIFVIPVTETLGIDRGPFMIYMTILSLVCVVASPILGKLMNKGSVKKWLAVGCVSGTIGYVIFAFSTSLTGFYIGALFLGICFAGTAPMPVSILINSWFGGKIKGTATGIAFVGSGLGGMILSPVLNAAVMSGGYQAGYFVLAGVYLIILLPLSLLLAVKSPEDKGFRRMGEVEEEKLADNASEKRGLTTKQAMATPEFWLALVSCVLVVFASSAILMNDIGYYVECGIDATKAASYHGLMLGALLI